MKIFGYGKTQEEKRMHEGIVAILAPFFRAIDAYIFALVQVEKSD